MHSLTGFRKNWRTRENRSRHSDHPQIVWEYFLIHRSHDSNRYFCLLIPFEQQKALLLFKWTVKNPHKHPEPCGPTSSERVEAVLLLKGNQRHNEPYRLKTGRNLSSYVSRYAFGNIVNVTQYSEVHVML